MHDEKDNIAKCDNCQKNLRGLKMDHSIPAVQIPKS